MPIVAGIQLYNSNKELLAYYASDVKTGQYTLPAKPNGDYYLVVNDFLNDTYISQIYDDIICENLSTCDATIGDAVIISDLNNVSNINFILKRDVIFTNGFGEAF